MSTLTLAISCLTTSNLPLFMDLTFQVPVQYCSLQHQTLLLSSPIQNWVLFLLWLHHFILSVVISPLISSSILCTYWPGELIFQYPIFLPFQIVHGVFKARILKWFALGNLFNLTQTQCHQLLNTNNDNNELKELMWTFIEMHVINPAQCLANGKHPVTIS